MGTRHLTAVYLDGAYKVAQYGQWDGYPEGAGLTVLEFLRDKMNIGCFKAALRNCSYISKDNLGALWRRYGEDANGMVTMEQADAMERDYPQFSRNTGADILELVQNNPSGMALNNRIEFAADSLFCEWAWVIDLDNWTFEVYQGFNQVPLTEGDRFYFLHECEDRDYHGVRMVEKWSLDHLPSKEEFLGRLNEDAEEDIPSF